MADRAEADRQKKLWFLTQVLHMPAELFAPSPKDCDQATADTRIFISDNLDISLVGVTFLTADAVVTFRNLGQLQRTITFSLGLVTETFQIDPGEEIPVDAVRRWHRRKKGKNVERSNVYGTTQGTITLEGYDDGTTKMPTTSVIIWVCLK